MPDDQALTDEHLMARAISLAARARAQTSPNPMVGCVIARQGRIVGEGWHDGPGLDHAEVAALKDARSRSSESLAGATAYVTLEPCNHTGRTGPCTEALKAAGVARVVYAVADPNPVAAGGGAYLAANGVAVEAGLLRDEAYALNRAWLEAQRLARPYVVAKSAMSLDGRIATCTGESKWITGEEARRAGHQLRMEADAIIVGAQTVIDDDPALTARLDGETRAPLRVVLDSTGRTPPGAKVFERKANGGAGAVLMASSRIPRKRAEGFRGIGADVMVIEAGADGRPDPHAALEALKTRNIVSVMIEGGADVLGAFLDADCIDELHIFQAPIVLGGGRPAFAGAGAATLMDADRFDFSAPRALGRDVHWRGLRKREAF